MKYKSFVDWMDGCGVEVWGKQTRLDGDLKHVFHGSSA
jgi:hypothetical protein